MRAPKGFTLIEVLIAMVIFLVLTTVVTQSLLPVFSMTRKAQVQFDANQQAQQVIEAIRSAWLDPAKYKKTCAPISLPAHVSVQVQALDNQARPTGTLTFTANCAVAVPDTTDIPAKRVVVTAKDENGNVKARIILDIPEP